MRNNLYFQLHNKTDKKRCEPNLRLPVQPSALLRPLYLQLHAHLFGQLLLRQLNSHLRERLPRHSFSFRLERHLHLRRDLPQRQPIQVHSCPRVRLSLSDGLLHVERYQKLRELLSQYDLQRYCHRLLRVELFNNAVLLRPHQPVQNHLPLALLQRPHYLPMRIRLSSQSNDLLPSCTGDIAVLRYGMSDGAVQRFHAVCMHGQLSAVARYLCRWYFGQLSGGVFDRLLRVFDRQDLQIDLSQLDVCRPSDQNVRHQVRPLTWSVRRVKQTDSCLR